MRKSPVRSRSPHGRWQRAGKTNDFLPPDLKAGNVAIGFHLGEQAADGRGRPPCLLDELLLADSAAMGTEDTTEVVFRGHPEVPVGRGGARRRGCQGHCEWVGIVVSTVAPLGDERL